MGQRKYPLELRERATRMTLKALAEPARLNQALGVVFFLAVVFFAAVVVFFLVVVFRAGFFAGPLARFSASSSKARSGVMVSGESSRRRVALVSPSVT